MWVSLLLAGSSLTTPQVAIEAASQTVVESGADGNAQGVNRIVGGIVSYTRSPSAKPGGRRNLCLVGAPRLAGNIAPAAAGGTTIVVRRTSVGGAMGGDCDIIFIGRLPVIDRQRLMAWVRGRPVLTITDDDPDCSFGTMFCLTGRSGGISFSVNLDAIGRGQLRVDPRVLKIGSDGDAR